MQKIIDPPNGWLYGFPATLPEGTTAHQLLVDYGYPEEHIEWALEHMRWWFEPEDGHSTAV
jgi:hypothetical protein